MTTRHLTKAVTLLAVAGIAQGLSAQPTWCGSARTHSRAEDPPSPLSAPNDLISQGTCAPGAGQRIWLPFPPEKEEYWNDDSHVLGTVRLETSWHEATSGSTQAQSKGKAGVDVHDALVAVARARVRDIVDGNLANNGGGNSASAFAIASVVPVYLVRIVGEGPSVDARIDTEAYFAGEDTAAMKPYMGVDTNTLPLPVGVAMRVGLVVEAGAEYPSLFHSNAGSMVLYAVTFNGQLALLGDVIYQQGHQLPVPSGNCGDMQFRSWNEPGSMGEWWQQNDVGGYYGAMSVRMSLPAGYRFEYAECYADCDTSTGVGVLDIFDFLCFGDKFDQGDPYACDCDTNSGPGICDIFDFICFGNAFSAGCP